MKTRDTSSRGEYVARIMRLRDRGMTLKAAAVVIDAAMFGLGCIEGLARVRIQKELEGENDAIGQSDSGTVQRKPDGSL
jgi:hypothetical protein